MATTSVAGCSQDYSALQSIIDGCGYQLADVQTAICNPAGIIQHPTDIPLDYALTDHILHADEWPLLSSGWFDVSW